jgi:AraC-like DNA-binding protein
MTSQTGPHDDRGLHGGWTSFQRHRFLDPGADLTPFVAHYWAVTWDLRGQPPYRQLVVPYPDVHLSFVNGVARVRGVARGHVFRDLDGLGRVFGVAFRPGCFRPFLGSSVSGLTDRSVPASEVFGPDVPEAAMASATDETAMWRVVERFLGANLPARDPVAEEVAGVVALVAAQPGITRVDDLAQRVSTSVRRLQRLFAEYVGIGPKWVIRRYRLHEITERMAAGERIDWARLAAELGYTDQTHLSRDFTSIVGESPTRYAQRYPERAGA